VHFDPLSGPLFRKPASRGRAWWFVGFRVTGRPPRLVGTGGARLRRRDVHPK